MSQQVDWNAKVDKVIQNQFGLKPKQQAPMYRVSCPTTYDAILYPHRYRVPDFTKFSGQDDTSTVEHMNLFIMQCGEDALRVQLFIMSLSGSAFARFTSLLPANSIIYWVDMQKQFHQFFYSGVYEKKLPDLTSLNERNDESVTTYIQRFKDIKNQCYNLESPI